MKLYHGTTNKVALKALTLGLDPRGARESNWRVESRPDCVYLTSAYAGYYAAMASEPGTPWGIVEVETDRLDQRLLLPDEDALEQAFRTEPRDGWPEGTLGAQVGQELLQRSMEERTRWFRERLPQFAEQWLPSVRALGTCAYLGAIPRRAIVRVSVYDPKDAPELTLMCVDPTITIQNYNFCGAKYRALTAWLMGEPLDVTYWKTIFDEDQLTELRAKAEATRRLVFRR